MLFIKRPKLLTVLHIQIDGVLGNLKTKFELLSSQILSRSKTQFLWISSHHIFVVDQMGERMDSLERSLTDLLDQSSNEDDK